MANQLNLFNDESTKQHPVPKSLDMIDADVTMFEHFFDENDSSRLFLVLNQEVCWRQDDITIFGRTIPQPRLTAWYGDPGKSYTYSGIEMNPSLWNEPLLEIKKKVEDVSGTVFNSVLLNKYRTSKDSVAWHSNESQDNSLPQHVHQWTSATI